MKQADDAAREVEMLRQRLSGLSEASLRISESLDLRTVLDEVLEGARALTGARAAAIAIVNRAGRIRVVATRGLTPDQERWLRDNPLGPRFCEYLEESAEETRRSEDFPSRLRARGFAYDPLVEKTYLATPIRHRGRRLGNFYLGAKQTGRRFTSEDEDILTLFSHQAGAAIANARRHRAEQRARADLETLVDMSPVGVLVLDGRTGQVKSVNQEASRMVNVLHRPSEAAEDATTGMQQAMAVMTVKRADGSEFAHNELPLAVREAKPTRAEEVVVQCAGGKSLSVLVNVAPIRSEDGAIESVLVTLQDMTPVEELQRLRTEFLGLVSHELRAPLTSIKGCSASVLGSPSPPNPVEMVQFFRIVDEQADHMSALISDLLDVARIESGTLSVDPRPEDLAVIVDQARNTFLSGGGRNPVRIDLPPDLPRVMADRQRVAQVLGNLLTNAAQHSEESSPIRLTARLEGVHVVVSIADDGKGIAAERLPYLFRKLARSGREERAQRVGAGLGLAICRGLVEAHGGRIWAESEGADRGARFTFGIPVAGETATDGAMGHHEPRTDGRRSGSARPRVLVVDDDPQALANARRALERAGYRSLVTGDATEVEDLVCREKPHLVLLDLILQGTDGIELMKSIPALTDLPVIFLSGYGRDETIAKALEGGAVDYIVKPFSPTELVARIEAALRTYGQPSEPYRAGDLTIDYGRRQVTVTGRSVDLTATEYALLAALAENAGRVSTHDYLLRRVWGPINSGDTRLVRAFVKKLRRKLGEPAHDPRYIFTLPRVGYRMAAPDG